MGLIDLFRASKEECAKDSCLNEIMRFVETVVSFESVDCPMLSVSFVDEGIYGRFFDCDNTAPCIYMNMLHRKQAEEDTINRGIRESIRADELPQGVNIEWHFDSDKDKYDYYVLTYKAKTTFKKSASKYCEIVRELCSRKGMAIENQEGTTLHIAMNHK